MVNLEFDGSEPLERLRPPKGYIFRQCTIRKWTPRNCQIASRRRCFYLLLQLPCVRWVNDFGYRVCLGLPKEIEAIELELRRAIMVYELLTA